MFANILNSDEFFSSHWNVVLLIGVAYLILQIALSLRLYLTARRHARILAKLARDFDRGGDGRGKLRAIPKDFTWLRWVHSIFPPRAPAASGNFTRDEVLNELDTRIASSSPYLLLQRLGVMAPLLGVILTVVGFFWLDVKENDDQSLQGILLSVTPLVIGVGAGAALALVNQALLYVVGGRIEALRMSARSWFDTVIWSSAGLDSQAATAKAIAAVERFTRTVVGSAERHDASTGRLETTTASMQESAALFREVVASFHGEIKGIPQTLCNVRDATAAAVDALEELIPVGTRAVANLDVSVAAFRSTIDREFAAASTLHDRASKALAESIGQICDSTGSLKRGSDELKRSAKSHAEVFHSIDESLRTHLVPGIQQFFDSAHTLTSQIAAWSDVVAALSANVEATAGELKKTATGLSPAVTKVRNALDERIDAAAAETARQVESIGRSTQALGESLAGIEDNLRAILLDGRASADFDRLIEALHRATEATEALAALPERLREVLEQNGGGHGALAKSRGGLRAWLPGRPR